MLLQGATACAVLSYGYAATRCSWTCPKCGSTPSTPGTKRSRDAVRSTSRRSRDTIRRRVSRLTRRASDWNKTWRVFSSHVSCTCPARVLHAAWRVTQPSPRPLKASC
eukprot:2784868-Rhodomonas_salina.2